MTGGDRRGTEGAVYVEFLIAFMPFFVFFLCLWQVAILYSTKILLDHAANSAARAGAVILGDDPARYDDEPINVFSTERMRQIRTAAELAVASLIVDKTIVSLAISFPGNDVGGSMQGMNNGSPVTAHMVVRLTAAMSCKIAIANAILCRAQGIAQTPFSTTVVSQGDYPYMGASYLYK